MATVLVPAPAEAAGTVLFANLFNDSTVDGTGTVTVPTSVSGANAACLTAKGNASTPPLLSCAGNIDTVGSGKLRLTNASTNQVGGVFGQASFPTSNGLDVTFNTYQWGGGSADGLSFLLAAVDPANPAPPASIGPAGGSLGYSPAGSVKGLTNAYLGIGLDVFGNYSGPGFQGTGCTSIPNMSAAVPGAVAVRGPGNNLAGYCGLATTYDGSAGSKLVLHATTRAASQVPVEVLVNPTSSSFTADSGVSVAPGTYKVVVTPIGQATKTLTGALPNVVAGVYPSSTWLSASGVPKQLAFAFVGSTGSVTDTHEISDVKVLTFNPVPQLSVADTSYSAPTSTSGDPVTYTVVPKVLAGANESSPVSVTQTVPVGVVASGAFGTGWACQTPVGRTVTCTTTASSFTNGTTLPTITVVGIVTAASVTDSFVQNNSTTQATSADANPGTDLVATAGTPAAAPTGIALNPAIGPYTGGTTVIGTGSSTASPTAIEIGTTAEQQAGTPAVLLPCTAGRAVGCFNIEGSSIAIQSMPARASPATVRVTFVTQGVAGFTSYVYAGSPAVPATPTATAGITSTTLTWVAPTANGSPITGYVVTPYLGGVAQATVNLGAGVTSNTFTGLAAGSSWAYTVAAVNAFGTSAASAKSTSVTPYALPGAPTITAVSAGTSSATLTWTAPAANGSAITGYVVTPFIGTTAQPAQTFGPATTQTATGLTGGTAYTFTVAAINAAGTGPASAASSVVTPNSSPTLNFPAPPAGEVGVAYSRLLTVTNGTSPFAWSVSTGALPAGLTLNASSGLLSGTPTSAGSPTFSVQVLDASGQTATRSVTLVIADIPNVTLTVPPGEVGIAYSAQPVRTGGTGPFSWAVSSGSLPAGLTISSSTGLVSGTPTAAGTFSVTVSATDSFNQVASRTVSLVIVAQPTFTGGAPAPGQVGVPYNTSFDVSGGTLPLTWSVAAGSLPPGLSLNTTTGALTGTPTTVGSSSFTVSVVDSNSQSATRAVTLVIGAGPLVINTTANVSTTAPGATVAYTTTITNTGSTAWTGASLSAVLTGTLDDARYNADASASSGTLVYTAPTLGWSGNIPASGTVTITYSVTVNNPDTGNKVLASTVTSTVLGTNCASGSSDGRCSTSVSVAGLAIVKTADVSSTTPGSTVHLQVVVTNTGPAAYSGATLSDSLAGMTDDGTYNSDAVATSGNVSLSGSALTWSGNLPVGGSATITYSVTVNDPDAGNRSLTGTIVSASPGSSCPSGNPAASCSVSVGVLVPALVITNTSSVSTTTPGATVPYTVTISNTGQTPYTATSVDVAFAGALDDATYDGNLTASAGAVSSNGSTLTWTGDLAVGAVVTLTGSVTVNDPDTGDKTLTTVASSSAAGSTCRPASPGPACISTVQVLVPGLTISKSAGVATTTPGSVVTYTVSVTNTGQTPYTSAALTDSLAGVLDDATYNGDASATNGAVAYASPTLTWTGNLAVGASATITYSVTVRQPDPGDRSLTGRVTSTTAGNNCRAASSDTRCTTSVPVLVPGLSIVSSSNVGSATPGDVVRFTLTVTNTGETTYTNTTVTARQAGVVDDATYDNDATVSTGTQSVNGDGSTAWTLSLAPGASATRTFSVTVNDPDTGDRALVATASSSAVGSTCPTGSSNPSCQSSVGVLLPGLTLTKTANRSTATPGDPVDYTVTVVNNGQTTYAAATFTDNLSNVLSDATYAGAATATSGTVSYSSPSLTWTGALAPGDSATVTYTVTVRDPDPGDKTMTNSVVSSSKGSNCPSTSTDARCTSNVRVLVPGLTIVKTADSSTTRPGAQVGYTVTVTNSGATPVTAAAFTESLSGVLDDAGYDADVAASKGTAGVAGGTLSWTGDLAVGASATVTYSVTVHAADTGDNLLTSTVRSSSRGNNCTTASTDTRCTTVVPVARLLLAYGPIDPTTTPGGTIHYSATFTNIGQVPYDGISVDVLAASAVDDGLPGNQTASSGTFVLGATGITWTGSIPVGGAVDLSATTGIKDPDPGDGILTATFQSSAPGNNCPAASTDPRCSVTVTVLTPQLTVTKVASTTATVPGGAVGYTITVQNTGQTPYVGAEVDDTLVGLLDDADYNADASATVGSLAYSSPVLAWTGDLAPGASAVITYSVTAHSPDTGDKTMVNSVSSSAVGSTCLPASGDAACHSTVAVLTPGLTILKTADRTTANLDTDVVYTVKVTNSGQTPYASAVFSDSLAGVLDDATYRPAATTATSGTVTFTSGVLAWSGALAPGSSATIHYTVTINTSATGDGTMSNTATSSTSGNNCVTGSADPRCTASVAVTNAVSLTFTTTADVAATSSGSVVTYTVAAVNSSDSSINAGFSDDLTGVLDDAAYDADATTSAGTVGFSSGHLTWSGPVPAGGTVTVTYSVTVNATATGDQLLAGTLTSALPTTSNNCLAGSIDPRCSVTVPVARLAIQQGYAESSTTPGSLIHLSATFTNTGRMPYTGITISSPSAGVVDDAVPTGDQTASSGTLVLSATAITWTGNIPVGGTVTIQGTLTVKSPDPGDKHITGTLVSQALGNNCPTGGTDARCTASLSVLVPGLTITKTADTTFVVPGGKAGYTITVHNTGQTVYHGAVVTDSLAGVLDNATYDGDATSSLGSTSFGDGTLTWTGDLAPGETATIGFSVTANSPATGDKLIVNAVSSTEVGSTCPVSSGNPDCRSTVVVLTPALTVTSATSTATTVPGATVTYTVTATNTGQIPLSGASLSADLGDVLDSATYSGGISATAGTATIVGSTLSWTGTLGIGDTTTITYAVVVKAVPADYRLAQSVVSTTQGSTCPPGGSDPDCSTTVLVAGLHILNGTDVSTTEPTGTVVHTVTFTNVGLVPYLGLSINDSFAGALDDAVYNGDATATSGSLVLHPESGSVVWTGDLAPGATVTVTGSLTVENPDQGNKRLNTLVSTDAAASNCPVGGSDPACATDVPVAQPALTITTTADRATASPGDRVAYTITATNTGQTDYTGATVSDPLDGVLNDATYDNDAHATSGDVTYAGSTLTWTGDLAGGESVELHFTVVVSDPYLGDGTVVNTAVSDELGSTCPTAGAAAGCTSVVTVLVPEVDLAVTADHTTTVPGGTVGYTVSIHNTGQTAYSGARVDVSLAGTLDDAVYDGNADATNGNVAYTAPTLTWTGDLAVGDTVTVSYTVTVRQPETGDRSMGTTLSSSATGATCGDACSNTVTVLIPGLAVSTSSDVATATPGDPVTFTILVSNTGRTQYDGTVVSTDLGRVLDDASFDGSVTASRGVATYSAPHVTWTGSLSPGETATIRYSVTVSSPDTGDRSLSTTVVDDAAGSTCPTGTSNSTCTTQVQVLIPGLTITTSAGSATTTPGSVVDYTVTVENTGETAYAAATVRDSLSGVFPDAVYNRDATVVGGGVLDYSAPVLTWVGALPVGATATISYSITVHDPDPGDKHLVNAVSSTDPGSTCPPAAPADACSVAVDVLVPALEITKHASATTVTAGDAVTYTLTVTDTGETSYAPAVVTDSLAKVLDDATYNGGATADRGSVDVSDGTLVWTGALGMGQTATITYTVTTDFPADGDHSLDNAVVSDSPGSDCRTGTEAACSTSVAVVIPQLTITKTTDSTEVVAGAVGSYTISATNTGEADYPAATLSDSLAGVLDDGTYDGDAVTNTGTLAYARGVLTWTGALPVGATATITYSVRADVADTGDAVLSNRVVSTTTGSTCAVGNTDSRCATSTPVAPRSIELSGLTPSFTLAGPPHSTVTSDGAVTMTVTTNDQAGYDVGVLAGSDRLAGASSSNSDTIPLDLLGVRETGSPVFSSLSTTQLTLVHSQAAASALGGDAVSNDFRIEIPNVTPDTYSTTLNYIVTAH